MNRSRLLVALFLAVAACHMGCGGGGGATGDTQGPVVTGKLTANGQVLKDPGVIGRLEIQLWPADAAPDAIVNPEDAEYNYTDGTFTAGESTGKGVKPGKYKVTVQYWREYQLDAPDVFNGAYSREQTTIEREVTADGKPLEAIDLEQDPG